MEIIIKGGGEELKRLKGKSVAEFGSNLEKEGWNSEFRSEGEKDRVKYVERKLGRPLKKGEIKRIDLNKI